MSRTWAGGSTRAWRELRRAVLIRDGLRCRTHDEGWCDRVRGEHTCTRIAALSGPNRGHAHHTLGKAVTGDDPNHIRAACQACNLHIGDPTKSADPAPRPATQW